MAHFGHPIPAKRADFNFAHTCHSAAFDVLHTSLRCRFPEILHTAHFWGHVMRFNSNRCYGSQEKCVFGKRNPKFILDGHWKFSHSSHRFRVNCDYSFQWDFLYSAPKTAVFWPLNSDKVNRFQFDPLSFRLQCRSNQFGVTHLHALPHSGYIAQFTHFLRSRDAFPW